jgi:hypothetical protein
MIARSEFATHQDSIFGCLLFEAFDTRLCGQQCVIQYFLCRDTEKKACCGEGASMALEQQLDKCFRCIVFAKHIAFNACITALRLKTCCDIMIVVLLYHTLYGFVQNIVILSPDEPPPEAWNRLRFFNGVFFIQGSLKSCKDLVPTPFCWNIAYLPLLRISSDNCKRVERREGFASAP